MLMEGLLEVRLDRMVPQMNNMLQRTQVTQTLLSVLSVLSVLLTGWYLGSGPRSGARDLRVLAESGGAADLLWRRGAGEPCDVEPRVVPRGRKMIKRQHKDPRLRKFLILSGDSFIDVKFDIAKSLVVTIWTALQVLKLLHVWHLAVILLKTVSLTLRIFLKICRDSLLDVKFDSRCVASRQSTSLSR